MLTLQLINQDENSKESKNEKLILTYPDFRRSIREISQNIVDDNYRADAILCVARGGLLVGAQLSYDLGIKKIGSINIEYYTGKNKRLDAPIILEPKINLEEFRNKKIIIADDVVDTGHTMNLLLPLLQNIVTELRVVVIFKKSNSVIDPAYFWKETPSNKWITFPWSSLEPL